MKNIIYNFSNRFFITSQMTKRIENRISIMYPSTKYSLIKKTEASLMKIYLTVVVAIVLLMIFAEFSLHYAMVVFLVSYALVSNRIYVELDRLEIKLLEELQKFLEDVKYRFRFDGMLEEALQEAINISEYHMAIHGERILSSLKNYHLSGAEDYEEQTPNAFFKTFYMMCKNVLVYGDKKVEGESYFIKNLSYLKDDIGIELLKRRKINNAFMGLLGITIIPVFAIKPIEKWALSNMENMSDMYDGMFGIISTILMAIISFLVFSVVLKLKYPYVKDVEKSKWVEKLAKDEGVRLLTLLIIRINYKKSLKLDRKLKNIGYPYDIVEFYVKRVVISIISFFIVGIMSLSISISLRKDVFNIWIVLFSVIGGVTMYIYEYLQVIMKERLMLMNREDELVKFHTIILMLKETDRISVREILIQMENFSYSFKNVLQEILYRFPFSGMKVFEEVKGKSGFLGFDRLMDNFRACDYMNINSAFEDVEKERDYYILKHKQDNEFMIEERSLIAKVISFVPICAVIITKLIVPFVVKGMSQINIF